MRLIDADAITTFINEKCSTVDAEPVRRGKWKYSSLAPFYFCSVCGNGALGLRMNEGSVLSNYCPHCGAKMDMK